MVVLMAHFPFYKILSGHKHVLLDEEMNNGSNFQQLARAQLTSFNCWAQKDSCVPNCTLQPLGYS